MVCRGRSATGTRWPRSMITTGGCGGIGLRLALPSWEAASRLRSEVPSHPGSLPGRAKPSSHPPRASMTAAREVLVVERVPELTAFFEALVSNLGDDVRLTIEPDAARAERLVVERDFDL